MPNRPLTEIARARATAIAEAQLARVPRTLLLEGQALDPDELRQQRERLIEHVLARGGSRLWEEP